jgi:aldehyde:ferredoxin oxidoreductase
VAKKRVQRVVKTKKRCCKSRPRCKRCPVVCKRLTNQGLAERVSDRHFVLSVDLRKKQLKAARG